MATNRIKASVEGSTKKRSPLTSAGKDEKEIAVDQQVGSNVKDFEDKTPKTESNKDAEPVEVKKEITEINSATLEQNNTFGFVIEKKAEPDIKKQKMYNLKLGNIRKVKDLADATGMSESAIIDFLIENGTKVITIK
jgi:hypothetical protein